jgi:carboxymethylenebutenolidase
MTEITIKAKDGGSFMAYLARPSGEKGPGLVLIQEIFGVNKVMRDLADGFAKQGYVVACPDLFWRQEPGIQITDKTEAEWAKAFSLYKGFDQAKGVDDLAATLDHVRKLPGVSGKVGCVGYCLGGFLAFVMATRTSADAAVSYYGVAIETVLDEVPRIKKPVLMHIAEKDEFVPAAAQAEIKKRVAANPNVTVHTYPGQNHAFARVGGQHYNKQAADQANARTADFLKKNLA